MASASDAKAAADKRMADDKKRLQQERETRAKNRDEHEKRTRGTPTPTQEELDLINSGHHPDLAEDGSTDPYAARSMEAAPAGGGYQTRQTTPSRGTAAKAE